MRKIGKIRKENEKGWPAEFMGKREQALKDEHKERNTRISAILRSQ